MGLLVTGCVLDRGGWVVGLLTSGCLVSVEVVPW